MAQNATRDSGRRERHDATSSPSNAGIANKAISGTTLATVWSDGCDHPGDPRDSAHCVAISSAAVAIRMADARLSPGAVSDGGFFVSCGARWTVVLKRFTGTGGIALADITGCGRRVPDGIALARSHPRQFPVNDAECHSLRRYPNRGPPSGLRRCASAASERVRQANAASMRRSCAAPRSPAFPVHR